MLPSTLDFSLSTYLDEIKYLQRTKKGFSHIAVIVWYLPTDLNLLTFCSYLYLGCESFSKVKCLVLWLSNSHKPI